MLGYSSSHGLTTVSQTLIDMPQRGSHPITKFTTRMATVHSMFTHYNTVHAHCDIAGTHV